jgi:Kef-type K+ transport system membrane component KefB
LAGRVPPVFVDRFPRPILKFERPTPFNHATGVADVWPNMPIEDPILQFTVLLTAALIVRLTVERLHLPGLVGLLVMGMLLGPGGTAVLPREPVVELLGDVGLIYLMFVAGLEIDLDIVRENRRETMLFGVLAFSCSLLPAVAAGLLMGYPLKAALLLGTLLSSHTLLAYPIIERLGLLHRRSVVTGIGGTLVTDTLALVLLAIVIQTAGVENSDGGGWQWLVPLVLLASIVGASLWAVPRFSRYFFRRAWITGPEKALYVLVVLLLLATAAELIGTEKILGAFLAGVCLNRALAEREELRGHLEFAGRLLFIPFFFVSTGMRLELEIFTGEWSVWLLAALLLALVVLGKATASWLIGVWYGYTRRDRLLLIGLTIPQAAATLAVTLTAREAGLFEEQMMDAVILLIFVTCLGGPLLTKYAGKRLDPVE